MLKIADSIEKATGLSVNVALTNLDLSYGGIIDAKLYA